MQHALLVGLLSKHLGTKDGTDTYYQILVHFMLFLTK